MKPKLVKLVMHLLEYWRVRGSNLGLSKIIFLLLKSVCRECEKPETLAEKGTTKEGLEIIMK